MPLFLHKKAEKRILCNRKTKPQVISVSETIYIPLRRNTGGFLWIVALRVITPFGSLSRYLSSVRKTVFSARISSAAADCLFSLLCCSAFTRTERLPAFWPLLATAVAPAADNFLFHFSPSFFNGKAGSATTPFFRAYLFFNKYACIATIVFASLISPETSISFTRSKGIHKTSKNSPSSKCAFARFPDRAS